MVRRSSPTAMGLCIRLQSTRDKQHRRQVRMVQRVSSYTSIVAISGTMTVADSTALATALSDPSSTAAAVSSLYNAIETTTATAAPSLYNAIETTTLETTAGAYNTIETTTAAAVSSLYNAIETTTPSAAASFYYTIETTDAYNTIETTLTLTTIPNAYETIETIASSATTSDVYNTIQTSSPTAYSVIGTSSSTASHDGGAKSMNGISTSTETAPYSHVALTAATDSFPPAST